MTTAHLIVRSSCLLSLLLPCTFHNAFSGESSCETTTDCPEDSVCSVQNQCVPRLRPGVGRQATVGVAISSAQKDFDYAQAAHKRGDYALALTTYRILSDRNYAPAQNNIGIMYLRGQGVPIDDRVALEFFRRAADKNYPIAQANLAFMYINGRGIAKNEGFAAEWYLLSANQNYAVAQNSLGDMYLKGQSVPKDDSTALHWYRKAAEQNDSVGQYNVAYMYDNGRSVSKNESIAASYYKKILSNSGATIELKQRASIMLARTLPPSAIANVSVVPPSNDSFIGNVVNVLGTALAITGAVKGARSGAFSNANLPVFELNQQNSLAPSGSAQRPIGSQTSNTSPMLCPNGTYVSFGPCRICPDGSYVGGGQLCVIAPDGTFVGGGTSGDVSPRIAPNGKYVGGSGQIIVCPDGSYVTGTHCVIAPNGKYVGH